MCFVETMNLDGETNLKQKQLALREMRPSLTSRPPTSLENTLTTVRGPSPRLKNLSGIQEEASVPEQPNLDNTLELTLDSTTGALAISADSGPPKEKERRHRHRHRRHREQKTSVASASVSVSASRPSSAFQFQQSGYSRPVSVMSISSVGDAPGASGAVEPFDPLTFKWKLICDAPNEKLDQFTGKLYVTTLTFHSHPNIFSYILVCTRTYAIYFQLPLCHYSQRSEKCENTECFSQGNFEWGISVSVACSPARYGPKSVSYLANS